MPNDAVYELINRQRNRVLASILSVKDECDLPREMGHRMRRVVLDEVNGFADLVLNIVSALDDESCAVNELWLERMAEMGALMHRGS